MSNVSNKVLVSLRKSALLLGAATVLSNIGCSSTEYAIAGDDRPAMVRGSAPHAWKKLREEAKFGDFLERGGILIGGDARRGGEFVGGMLKDAERQAQAQADRALLSPLPAKALGSMAEEAARDLVIAIPAIPAIRDSRQQNVIAFPELLNSSNATDPQLSIIFDQIRSSVFKNEAMTANLLFVHSTERDADRVIAAVAGSKTEVFRDPLQRAADRTTAVTYAPDTIYLTTGTLSCYVDNVNYTVETTFTVNVSHARSRKTEWSRQYTRRYMWHPTKHLWEPQDSAELSVAKY